MENLNNSYKANPMLFNVGLSPMNIGMKPVRYEARKKFVPACREYRTDPVDLALSVPSKVSNQTIILSAGTVGSRNFVLRKLSKP